MRRALDPGLNTPHQGASVSNSHEEGVGGIGFSSLINELIKKSNIGILCLLETNVSGNKARNIINKFSLDMSYVVEAQGQAGGIWYFTSIYARPHVQSYRALETSKSVANNQIADQIDGPWSLFGDFNVLLQDHKHCGGSQRALLCGDMAFQNFVQDYHLMDKGYQVPRSSKMEVRLLLFA
ncbi:hypothetical protein JHK85_016660 [Glycine max]|nr:hypothetical protein JHK85_016660 [Glycine max]